MRKKICSILLLIILLLNSSVMTIISTAVEAVGDSAKSTNETQEKVSMDLSYTQLTNKVQNEMVITGTLERDTEDDPLYENPVITFEMPSEVEKVVINDIKVLYDDELKLGEYEVTQNESGNQVVKIPLKGKQTKYQTDGINKGTAVRVSANVILKQDIKTADTKIVMTCIDGTDSTKTAKCEKTIKVVNSSEIPAIAETIDEEGTKTYANGLLIENKAILGDTVLKDDDIVYEDEIIKYEVKITNTTDKDIDNIKVVGKIPDYMVYTELYTSDFWGDIYEYRENENLKEKVIEVEKLEANQTVNYYYEVKVGEIDTRTLIEKVTAEYYDERGMADRESKYNNPDEKSDSNEELYNDRIKTIKEIILKIQPEISEEEEQKIVDEIMYKFYTSTEKLVINRVKNSNFDYEQKTEFVVNTFLNNEIVSKNNLRLNIKLNELKIFIEQGADRKEKNKWNYNVKLYNETMENKKGFMHIQLPNSFKFIDIRSLLMDDNGEDQKIDYEIDENGLISIKFDLDAKMFSFIRLGIKVVDVDENLDCSYHINLSANAVVEDGGTYWSNQTEAKGGIESVKITQVSEKNGEKLQQGEEIKYTFYIENIGQVLDEFGGYTEVEFEDYIPNLLEISNIEYDDTIVNMKIVDSKSQYDLKSKYIRVNSKDIEEINKQDKPIIKLKFNVKVGETNKIEIKAKVKKINEQEKNEIIENYAIVNGTDIKTKQSNIITNNIYKKTNKIEDVVVGPTTSSTKPTETTKPTTSTQPENNTYIISGKAWIDENENGKVDEGEETKEGLQVYLYDITNKKFVTDEKEKTKIVKTDKNGKYSFEGISNGKYYIIIEYDSNEYTITDYQKSGVSELTNCDFISKEVIMFKEQKRVGMTNTINLESNIENIDIGLVKNKIFDLKMEQYIQKITVSNSNGTKEYNYNNKKLAKVEIHSKQFNGSTVVIEYKIKVTNVGELAGNVNEIIDEIPSKLDFHSELNTQWSKSMTYNLSNTSYRTTEIKPGESIEATLILSKTLDNDSAGTLKNITKIGISENAKHIEDNNKDNDTDSTEVIIGISTGVKEVITLIIKILLVAVTLLILVMLIRKLYRIPNKKMFIFVIMLTFIVGIYNMSEALVISTFDDGYPHVGDNGKTYKCLDPNVPSCSIGHSYTLIDEGPTGKEWDEYPDYISSDGKQHGEIPLEASITITSQSTFDLKVICYDTTDAPGEIVVDITWTGGSDQITFEAGGGEKIIHCSGAEFILDCTLKATKTCKTEYTHWKEWEKIYKGTPEVHCGHTCTECKYEDKVREHCQHRYEGFCGAENDDQLRDTDAIHVKDVPLDVQRMAEYWNIPTPIPITYTWTSDKNFGPENFPKKLVINKVDYDTNEILDGCRFSISPTTLGGVSEFNGNETIDMVMPGSYTITEISAPYGYQYGIGTSTPVTISGEATETISVTWVNKKVTGNLNLKKIDSITKKPLAGVVFEISGLLDGDKNGTRYTTDKNGEINIYDILLDKDGSKTLTVKEIYNPYYGYVTDDPKYGGEYTITIKRQPSYETDTETGIFGPNVFEIENTLKYAKISGYVWEDGLIGKDGNRNNLYNENENDKNDKLLPGVKVILHDPINNTTHEVWTDENGAYVFGSRKYNGDYSNGMTTNDADYSKDNILLERANEYWIEFEYNGVKYRNVTLNTEPLKMNVSRASEEVASGKENEDSTVRQKFNERFSTISSGNQINSNGESTGTVINETGIANSRKITYDKNGDYQSQINYGKNMTEIQGNKEAYGEEIYHITATTQENYDFSTYVDSVRNTTGYTDEIKYVNLGLYSREQVDVAIDSDVEKFMLNIDGYEHTYTYNGVKEESFNEQMDVKLKELQNKYYERQLHESSVAYSATETGKNLYAEITYKVYLQNKSELQAQIKKLKLDYDSSLILKSYNYYNETNQERSEIIGINEEIPTIQDGKLRETIIDLEQIKVTKGFNPIISANGKNVLEITFRINANTISKIVNNPEGIKFDFMAEVESYSTYAKNEENAYRREEGTYAYASIDKNSAAGNTPVEIDNNKFITDKFENDTTIAPTFKLSKGSQTVISGIVYEDSPENGSEVRERVGDGKYDSQNENVMGNVLVELIKVSKDAADSVRDSSQKQKQVYNQDNNNIAHLYKTPTNNDDPVDTGVIARTYTKNDGTYEFSGVIPGKYVIRFVYGKNMQEIDSNGKYTGGNTHTTTIYYKSGKQPKEIEAREYKSTIITGNYISKALNITNGKEELNGDYSWFLNDKDENGTRYSDAVDDVEYRAQLEKDATVDNGIVTGSKEYVYTEMQAHTAYFKLGVEADDNHNEANSATLITDGNGTLDYTYSIKNIDLGIIKRPVVDLQVDKQITGLKVSLGNGQVLINGNPQTDKLPYVRTGLDDFVPIEMDTEILHGATLEEEYTITIKNNSELDYAIYPILSGETFDSDIIARRRYYYYYGKTDRLSDTEKQKAVTTRISVLGDYLGNELTVDEDTMAGENWEAKTIEDIANLLSEDSKKAIKDGKYTIYTTGTFADPDTNIVTIGSSKSIKYKVSKLLSTTADTMRYTNDVEILQYLGYSQNNSQNKNTTPGNLIPGKPQEDDEDFVRTTITPPTGTIISRWLYVTTAVAGLILVGATIIFIKKRILVK